MTRPVAVENRLYLRLALRNACVMSPCLALLLRLASAKSAAMSARLPLSTLSKAKTSSCMVQLKQADRTNLLAVLYITPDKSAVHVWCVKARED